MLLLLSLSPLRRSPLVESNCERAALGSCSCPARGRPTSEQTEGRRVSGGGGGRPAGQTESAAGQLALALTWPRCSLAPARPRLRAGWLAAGARSIVFRDDAVGGYTLLGGSSETPAAPLRGERRGEITGAVIRLPLRSERRTSKLNCSARKFKFKFHSNKRLLWDPRRRRRRGRRGCCHCGRRCH